MTKFICIVLISSLTLLPACGVRKNLSVVAEVSPGSDSSIKAHPTLEPTASAAQNASSLTASVSETSSTAAPGTLFVVRSIDRQSNGTCLGTEVRTSDNPTTTICLKMEMTVYQESAPADGQFCGGGRKLGRSTSIPSNDCIFGELGDNSCDRTGCAVVTDTTTGESGCPSYATQVLVSDNPTYFLCRSEIPGKTLPSLSFPGRRVGDLCGGARFLGKRADDVGNACRFYPYQSGNRCDAWGCAVEENAQGDAKCPEGTVTERTADNLSYFVCRIAR